MRAPEATPVTLARMHSPQGLDGGEASAAARVRFEARYGRPLFCADWEYFALLHFEIDPAVLQPHVPFKLDLHAGKAWVSLVAFEQRNVRWPRLPRASRLLTAPTTEHRFLNLRTYVTHRGEPGIHFLAEWVSNPLARILGPLLYGLPYRLARLRYAFREGCFDASAHGVGRGRFAVQGVYDPPGAQVTVEERARAAFLLERYTAFNVRFGKPVRFRIWHAPWELARMRIDALDTSLPQRAYKWWDAARFACAQFSRGVFGVWIGPPEPLAGFRA